MNFWRPIVFAGLLLARAGVCAGPALPVAVFWVGEDGGASIVPAVDISAIENAFVGHGYRLLRADGASAAVFARVILADRALHPESYTGQVVPLIVHGRGVVGGSAGEDDALLGLPRKEVPQVRDQDLLAAFLVGIGADAKGEISLSGCFNGQPCTEVSLVGTPLEGRVTRFIIAANESAIDDSPEGKSARVLARLLDIVLNAAGKRNVNSGGTASSTPQPTRAAPREPLVDVRDRLLRQAPPSAEPVGALF